MSEGNSLIDFGDLSKPATVLIEKVSDLIGASLKPVQMKRVAKAEIEVAKMKAEGALELTDIEQRGLKRLAHEEGKKQENIESITFQAIKSIKDDASPELIQDDWLSFFYDKCRIVSDVDMQTIWSNILAGEANAPGTFSKRTVDLVASLDKEEAHIFTKLCSYTIYHENRFIPLLLKKDMEIINDVKFYSGNISFNKLSHLESIGLINYEGHQGFASITENNKLEAKYFESSLVFELPKELDNMLYTGDVLLTRSGQELAIICGATKNEDFLNYISNFYKVNENVVMKVL